MPGFEQLIPELKACEGDIDSWIATIGRFDHAISYGYLFWPEFKIHNECVLFAECPAELFDHWMQATGRDLTAVETVLNHRQILDLFWNSEFKPTREAVLYLGRLLWDMWSCKLKRDFPAREIIVSFDEEFSEDLAEYEITFFQKR